MAVVMEEAAKLRGVLKNEPISVRCICVCVCEYFHTWYV